MRLIHQDGRYQTVQDAAYQRHADVYTRAGWRPTNQRGGEPTVAATDGVRIRSKHNEERTVAEDDFVATYEPAGWVRVDETAPSADEPGAGGDGAAGDTAKQDAKATRKA